MSDDFRKAADEEAKCESVCAGVPHDIFACPENDCCDGYFPDGWKCSTCQGSGFVYVTPALRVLSDRQEDPPSDEEIDYYRWETP